MKCTGYYGLYLRNKMAFHLFVARDMKTVAYLRISTGSQDLANQKLAILDYARQNRFAIDRFIEAQASSRKGRDQRRIEELLAATGRKRSEVELAVSPYTKKITQDDLKRYRDAGVDEVVLVNLRPPREEAETIKDIESIARAWVEPASRL